MGASVFDPHQKGATCMSTEGDPPASMCVIQSYSDDLMLFAVAVAFPADINLDGTYSSLIGAMMVVNAGRIPGQWGGVKVGQ
jgi:hypothetical protein